MTEFFKPDASSIVQHIQELTQAPFLKASNQWWPKFIYHFTNINNAVKILEGSCLYSRAYCLEHGIMSTDNASADVIDNTSERWIDYVRLYFRPRTPTQYRNEGYRPLGQRELNSHCPIPIFFLFNSSKLLSRQDVMFSDASLARQGSNVFSSAADFKKLPFNLIYHDDVFDKQTREGERIIGARHAEVIVPNQLVLDDLAHIWCRSEGEYKTLLAMLSDSAKAKWKSKTGSGKKGNFYYRNWLFIEQAELDTKRILFRFNAPNYDCQAFPIMVEVIEQTSGRSFYWHNPLFLVPDSLQLEVSLSSLPHPESYRVALYFEDQVMFMDNYNEDLEDVPF